MFRTPRTSRTLALAFATIVSLAFVPSVAHAADTGGGAVEPPSSVAAPLTLGGATTIAPAAGAASTAATLLAEGRTAIAAKKWPDAITALKKAAALDPKNADIQNLLGFSTRNNGDYPGALVFYDAALKLNPNHLGALEYQGEAFVKLGQMPKAKANMATLKKLCGTSCEQYKDLAAAVKAAGKKK
jgi:tetratricopeptide (TPR) repeat protein